MNVLQYKDTDNKPAAIRRIKEMTKDKSLKSLALTIFKAMAYESCISDLVKPKQQEVISFYKFKTAQKWHDMAKGRNGEFEEYIDKAEHMYLASEEDFNIYLKEMYKYFCDNKVLNVPQFGYCPLLMAEELTRKAQRYFVEALEPYTGFKLDDLICSGLKIYKKYIDLNLSLFAKELKIEES